MKQKKMKRFGLFRSMIAYLIREIFARGKVTELFNIQWNPSKADTIGAEKMSILWLSALYHVRHREIPLWLLKFVTFPDIK